MAHSATIRLSFVFELVRTFWSVAPFVQSEGVVLCKLPLCTPSDCAINLWIASSVCRSLSRVA